jgi:A/G-specific adenine glycosylase
MPARKPSFPAAVQKPRFGGVFAIMARMPALLRELKAHYKAHKRSLPWRTTTDPYRILVSEIMLQQTQVDRVMPYYNSFLKQFPTAKKLAVAPLSKVLLAWQGLGYNRRAKYLHEASKIIVRQGWGGRLPGVGPYTAAAIDAFAHNKPTVFVETNIRTVFFHHLYGGRSFVKLSDAQLLPLVEEALKKSRMQPRDFYAALMDYGSHLKKQGIKLNNKSKHYTKQSKFEGSARQLRGAILRELLKKPATQATLIKNLSRSRGEVERELARLSAEALIEKRGKKFAAAA